MSTVAAVVIRKEKDLVRCFQQANAVSMHAAKTLDALGIGDDLAFKRLRRRDVIREASPGTFYLDERAWRALNGSRRRLALLLLFVGLALAIGAALVAHGSFSF